MRRSLSSASSGARAEQRAEQWLTRRGLHLLVRNYRCRQGEIDLIMKDGNTLVFVEVRLRSRSEFGSAAASVGHAKQRRLVKAAAHFLAHRPALAQLACRFDVVAMVPQGKDIDIHWIRNAFSGE